MLARVVEAARHGFVNRFDEQSGFATTRYAGDAGEGAERDFGTDIFEVVRLRAGHLERFAIALTALGRHSDLQHAGEILASQAFGVGHDVIDRAFGHDFAAVDAGTGADVHNMIGHADGVFVMLDDDHGVTEIAKTFQGFQQPVIVALVEADGGFVQHIKHAGEAGADLRGQTDALAFAT